MCYNLITCNNHRKWPRGWRRSRLCTLASILCFIRKRTCCIPCARWKYVPYIRVIHTCHTYVSYICVIHTCHTYVPYIQYVSYICVIHTCPSLSVFLSICQQYLYLIRQYLQPYDNILYHTTMPSTIRQNPLPSDTTIRPYPHSYDTTIPSFVRYDHTLIRTVGGDRPIVGGPEPYTLPSPINDVSPGSYWWGNC